VVDAGWVGGDGSNTVETGTAKEIREMRKVLV
jgi:hypothetical protein